MPSLLLFSLSLLFLSALHSLAQDSCTTSSGATGFCTEYWNCTQVGVGGVCASSVPNEVTCCVAAPPSDYLVVPAPSPDPDGDADLSYSVVTTSANGHTVTGYLAVVKNPIDHFHVYYSKRGDSKPAGRKEGKGGSKPGAGGAGQASQRIKGRRAPQALSDPTWDCGDYANTSTLAAQYECLFAVNGGPFVMNLPEPAYSCLGFAISDEEEGWLLDDGSLSFGFTSDNNFVLGSLGYSDVTEAFNFTQIISTFGWLVREGEIQPSAGGEIAPRTAVGLFPDGSLMLLEADGCEETLEGLTLQQLALWMQSLGAYNAINLDGGGSSTAWYDGQVVNQPNCDDKPNSVCERPVTSILCIR